ncbi:MAG: hypothetical protein ACP5O1_01555 [Phycisphaerae bacterium]
MFNLRKSLVVAVLTAAVGAGYVVGSIAHSTSSTAQAITVPVAPINMAHGRDHRNDLRVIFMAAKHLRKAAKILRRGEKEYGGHREAALRYTFEALKECKEAVMVSRHRHG